MNKFLVFAAAFALMGQASPESLPVESSLMMPEGASFEIGADGNFLVDGKPRFLIGNLYYGGFGADTLAKGPGYGDEYAWIYENAPDRAYLQRLTLPAERSRRRGSRNTAARGATTRRGAASTGAWRKACGIRGFRW